MSLESLFERAADAKLHLNNLFQKMSGTWQCNVRDAGFDPHFYSWAEGDTASEALGAAIDIALAARAKGQNKHTPRPAPAAVAVATTAAADDEDLIG